MNLLKKWYSSIHRALSGYFNQLLISLVLLFVFRPYDRGYIYMTIWETCFVLVFLSAIFNCDHSKKMKIFMICCAIPSLFFHWFNMVYPNFASAMIFLTLTIIFIIIATASIIKQVVINARVRLETLKGVVCAYFMIAFGFAFLFFMIDLIMPGTFNFSLVNGEAISHPRYVSEMMYFSFVTLLCIGFGDITAVRDIGQTFVILEGIIGQFYIAILVARLVSVYSFYEHKLHLPPGEKEKK